MADPRISGRTGGTIALNVTSYRNGVPSDPYAIRRIDIYNNSEKDENLVASAVIADPGSAYPAPLSNPSVGVYTFLFDVPADFEAPGAYVDVWRFIGTDPGTNGDITDESIWHAQCNKFWIFPDGFYLDDGLVIPRFAFESLDRTFKKPEIRTLEVGLMPLPLYDFDLIE